jgi:hypothetical protein
MLVDRSPVHFHSSIRNATRLAVAELERAGRPCPTFLMILGVVRSKGSHDPWIDPRVACEQLLG